MGGGGVNEPTPGKKKYPSDKAIVVQPRFVEPFYRNYDLYDVEGVDGPAKHGPGSGWNHMNEFKSIKEFLDYRRERLKGKYVATDDWIEDTAANRKQRVEKMKLRAQFFAPIIKLAAKECQDSDIIYTDRRDAFICGNCLHMGPNSGGKTPTAKVLHAGKNHNSSGTDWRNKSKDDNDGPNFDYGKGLYSNMDKYKSVKDFEEHADKGPGAFFADDNKDHMLPPKEHGTNIYDWKNSPYQGKPKAPKPNKADDAEVKDDGKPNYDLGSGLYENMDKYDSVGDFIEHTPLGYKYPAKIKTEKERAKDVNHIDFPVDDEVNHDSMNRPEEGQ
jgi:hypothetical protein